jgi:hypothetical protein
MIRSQVSPSTSRPKPPTMMARTISNKSNPTVSSSLDDLPAYHGQTSRPCRRLIVGVVRVNRESPKVM